jgi:hypothetical protein
MPKDTRDPCKYLNKEIILTILRWADEKMLSESGNAVYIKMKKELDEIRWVVVFLWARGRLTRSCASTGAATSENKLATDVDEKTYVLSRGLIAPILGIRFTADGKRLVYRVNPPVNQYLVV